MSDSDDKTVLYLSTSSGPGGAERVIQHLAAFVDRRRFRPLICLFRPGWLKEQCEREGVPTYVLPCRAVWDWNWVLEVRKIIRRERVVLIHAHEFDAIVHGTAVARLLGIPIVATVHGKHYYWEKFRRRLAYRLVSRYATIVAVSEDLKRFIVGEVGISSERIRVIYNGVGPMPRIDQAELAELKTELGIDPSEQVVGLVGSLYPVKGHKYLLEAVPTILKTYPRTTFIIIGRGELEVALKEETARLGLEPKVRFLGLRQDVPRLLALMDVFVLPSLSEGLSMALLEAMAAGKPAVATNVGGNPELVVQGETGLLVPSEDCTALASEIGALLSNRGLASRFGEAARARVERRFSLNAMVNNYQSLYDTC